MFSNRIKVKDLLALEPHGQDVVVMGWVRTFRNNQFVALNDGSTNQNMQVVLELGKFDDEILKRITTSASLKVKGKLTPSLGKGQKAEVKAEEVQILGDSDAEKYPLQPKKHSLEFLREIAHLRFRTNTFGSVFRVRQRPETPNRAISNFSSRSFTGFSSSINPPSIFWIIRTAWT